MDPAETFQRLLDAMAACEWAEVQEIAADLRDWVAKGGFSPMEAWLAKQEEPKKLVWADGCTGKCPGCGGAGQNCVCGI